MHGAATFLLGAWAAELGVTAAVLAAAAGVLRDGLLGWGGAPMAPSLALAAAGLVLLWPLPPGRCRGWGGLRGVSVAAGGCVLALTTPGVWSWWATIGLALVAFGVGVSGGLATGVAVVAGMGTSHLLLLAGLRAPAVQKLTPSKDVQRGLGVALLVVAALLELLS